MDWKSVPDGALFHRCQHTALPGNRCNFHRRGRKWRRCALVARVVRRGRPGGGFEARLADRSWNCRGRRGETSMKNGAIQLRPALVLFLLGAALCAAPFLQNSAAQEKPGHTIFYTHGRIYTNDLASPW